MMLVQSVIRRLPNSLCPSGRTHGRTHGWKWSLLKVREGSMMDAGGLCRQRENASLPQVLLKLHSPMGREEPGDSHPMISEWGGGMGGSQPDAGGLGLPWATCMSVWKFPYF
jgi:hypothetical protein